MSVVVGQRHVEDTPANRMFYALDSCRELAVHTIRICSNEEIFDARYRNITQKTVEYAVRIYMSAWSANNVLVKTADDWKIRRQYQRDAVLSCNTLLAMIDLSKQLYHLRSRKVKYWAMMVIKTRTMLRKWAEADQKRYGKLQQP